MFSNKQLKNDAIAINMHLPFCSVEVGGWKLDFLSSIGVNTITYPSVSWITVGKKDLQT